MMGLTVTLNSVTLGPKRVLHELPANHSRADTTSWKLEDPEGSHSMERVNIPSGSSVPTSFILLYSTDSQSFSEPLTLIRQLLPEPELQIDTMLPSPVFQSSTDLFTYNPPSGANNQ
jgi:hypothetical protein